MSTDAREHVSQPDAGNAAVTNDNAIQVVEEPEEEQQKEEQQKDEQAEGKVNQEDKAKEESSTRPMHVPMPQSVAELTASTAAEVNDDSRARAEPIVVRPKMTRPRNTDS